MSTEILKMIVFVAASTAALTMAILVAARAGGGRAPDLLWVFVVSAVISAIGIPFGKYGQNFGLPWQVYYTVPAAATILAPPFVFRFSILRSLFYLILALFSAPLIHAMFFYGLGWSEYMPFLKLPR